MPNISQAIRITPAQAAVTHIMFNSLISRVPN